ncbi:hypothetical protein DRP43_06090, partial [candidate division TA06 bacterium]
MRKKIEEKFPLRKDIDLTDVDDKTLNLIYDECHFLINRQDNSISSIRNRAGILIGFIGVIFATILSSNKDIVYSDIVFYGGIITLSTSLLLAIFGWLPTEYKDISPYDLYDVFIKKDSKVCKDFIADLHGSHFEINGHIIRVRNI